MGKALQLVADQLNPDVMPRRALPPVLVLISDGKPTDDFNSGLRTLMDQPWGKKAVRIAIAIGDDADKDTLQRFIGHPELEPLRANNAEALVKYVKWVSTGGATVRLLTHQSNRRRHHRRHQCAAAAGPDDITDADDVW